MKKFIKNNKIEPQHRIIVSVGGKQIINPSETREIPLSPPHSISSTKTKLTSTANILAINRN
jgi:hypothetical protein